MIKKIFHKLLCFLDNKVTVLFSPRYKKTIIVIRTDAIGDYILFRNFLKPLYEKYGKLTLVGNIVYKNLANEIDGDFIDEFIAIDRKLFTRNPFYRFSIIKKICMTSYQTLINPIYSRDKISEDIVKIVRAKEKIASQGDTSNLDIYTKKKYDKSYSKILPETNDILFEFDRNLNFFKNLLSTSLKVEYSMKTNHLQNFSIRTPYSVLFIGASDQYRKWGVNNFIDVGFFLNLRLGEKIIVCGGIEDIEHGKYIQEKLQSLNVECINLCGQTTLTELAKILDSSNILISNETSAVHLAMSLRCKKVFVISNGNHLYRFSPYPKKMANGRYCLILHPLIESHIHKISFAGKTSTLDINKISPHMVIEKILENH